MNKAQHHAPGTTTADFHIINAEYTLRLRLIAHTFTPWLDRSLSAISAEASSDAPRLPPMLTPLGRLR